MSTTTPHFPAPTNPVGDGRMVGMSPTQIADMHAAARAIRDRAPDMAHRLLDRTLEQLPDHPEALRLKGLLLRGQNRLHEAIAAFSAAAAQWQDDWLLCNDLASAQFAAGERENALTQWERATTLAPEQPMPWFNLGRNRQMLGDTDGAIAALAQALARSPEFLPARILLADAYAHHGRFDDSAAQYRTALQYHPACGDAWRGLSNIKTRTLSDDDIAELRRQLKRRDIVNTDAIAMAFALGKAEEDRGRHAEAFAATADANTRMRALSAWSAEGFRSQVQAAMRATQTLPAPIDPTLGQEAILIVGLPRSGSTLVEQILAAHPDVEGASELSDMEEILQAESKRHGMTFPHWLPRATAEDWHRLGQAYMARTRRWRERRPRFTDKMPENWQYAGLLRAMLPGAIAIETRRDPLETGWSCFRQQFYRLPHFACDLRDIGRYLTISESAMDLWRARDPARIRLQHYEALQADFETEVRALLDACGLAFDPACIEFHRAERSVRTASAAQVRQPLQRNTARAAAYGALLDPLRRALEDRRYAIVE